MTIHHYPSKSAEQRISAIVNRGLSITKKHYQAVARITDNVRRNGDAAVIGYVNQFDSPRMTTRTLKVTDRELAVALKKVDRPFVQAINRAATQIEAFHRTHLRESWMHTPRPGALIGQLINPVDAVGVYVPGAAGGKTPLVSTVLMTAIPARIAGVPKIVMTTPASSAGRINPYLLAAAQKVGVSEIYKVGSAWAIAALAYGTETIPKVDVIVGPGNIFVTVAKKIVSGIVGIDVLAGPSEILIIADHTANPAYTAADLLSQAEHDVLSSAVLVTNSNKVATAVAGEVERQLTTLSRKDFAKKAWERFGAILVVKNITSAIELANRIAPEHLELHLSDPFEYIDQIRNAGAVFLGHYTPEPVGDYIAGPNHVLPTAGTARFSSALGVDHFIKKTSLIQYSRAALRREAQDIIRLAEIEHLDAHARSIHIRI